MAWIDKENNDDKFSTLKERPYYFHHSYINLDDTNSALSLLEKISTKDEILVHLLVKDPIIYGRQGRFGFCFLSN